MSRASPRPYWGLRLTPWGLRAYGGLRLGRHFSVGTSQRIAGPFSPGRGGKHVRAASHLGVALVLLLVAIYLVGKFG
jgi:hypothetical protein